MGDVISNGLNLFLYFNKKNLIEAEKPAYVRYAWVRLVLEKVFRYDCNERTKIYLIYICGH